MTETTRMYAKRVPKKSEIRLEHLPLAFQQNFDFSLIENFHITERQGCASRRISSTASITRISPVPSMFGQITNTKSTPRLIQFWLRCAF